MLSNVSAPELELSADSPLTLIIAGWLRLDSLRVLGSTRVIVGGNVAIGEVHVPQGSDLRLHSATGMVEVSEVFGSGKALSRAMVRLQPLCKEWKQAFKCCRVVKFVSLDYGVRAMQGKRPTPLSQSKHPLLFAACYSEALSQKRLKLFSPWHSSTRCVVSDPATPELQHEQCI